MYYPVSVGGPLTRGGGQAGRPVRAGQPRRQGRTPIYAGNYDDARTKALAALKAGTPVQTSVLFSIDLFELKD